MSAVDVLRSDIDYALSGFFGESIEYKSLSGKPESIATWEEFDAIVERSAEELGSSADFGRSPILVSISKTSLSSVAENIDKIRFNDKVYKVAKIVSEDAGGWELYCTS